MKTTTTSSPPPGGLGGALRDERGAILVMGIFMCTTLVGALWYLAAIGDAMLYRERVQEAADAVVFSHSVLHARGMNLLVLINVLMACILGVRVALKVAQLVVGVAGVIFFVIGIWVSPFMSAAKQCAQAVKDLQTMIDDTRDAIDNGLDALQQAGDAVSRATPALASAASMLSVGPKYAPVVTKSLVIDHELAAGLPVEDGSSDKLCGEAGRAVGGISGWMLDKIGLGFFGEATTWLGDAFAKIATIAPGFFCDFRGGSGDPSAALGGMLDKNAEKQCEGDGPPATYKKENDEWLAECASAGVTCQDMDARESSGVRAEGTQQGTTTPEKQKALDEKKEKRDAAARSQQSYDKRFGSGGSDTTAECEEWAKEDGKREFQAQQQKQKQQSQKNQQQNSGDDPKPKRVKTDWKNGGKDAQFVGGVLGEPDRLKLSGDLVRVAAVGDKGAADLEIPVLARVPGWAQAEVFYDCSGEWNGDKCNKDEDAMWHFQWRARLRRYNASKSLDKLFQIAAVGANANSAIQGVGALASRVASAKQANVEDIGTTVQNGTLLIDLAGAVADTDALTKGIH